MALRARDLFPIAGWLVLAGAILLGLAHDPEPIDLERFAAAAHVPDLPAQLAQPGAVLGGRVLDGEGRGLAGALVAVENGARLTFTHANEEGHFELCGVPQGELEALVLARGYPPARIALPAPIQGARLVLEAPFDPSPQLQPLDAAELRGLVALPPDLRGVEPAFEVWLEPIEPPDAASRSLRIPRRALVDGKGGFLFELLALGSYRVRLLPAWARGGSWPDVLDPDSGTVLVHAGLEPVLAPVVGSVTLAVVREGEPLEGALALLEQHAEEGARPWPVAYTNAAGRLVLLRLPAARYHLRLGAGADVREWTFDLEPSQELDLGLLELAGPPARGASAEVGDAPR